MARRPHAIDWHDSIDDLQRALAAERHPLRRQRLQALLLLRQGATLRDTAAAVGVSPRTVQRWLALYRTCGTEVVTHRVLGHRAGRPCRLTPDQQARLAALASAGEFPTIADAMAWVRREWGIAYTYKGMHALLARLGRSG